MKPFLSNNHAEAKAIGAVIGIFITLVISVLLVYNMAATVDTQDLDNDLSDSFNLNNTRAAHSGNATNDTLSQIATFYQIAPIIGIVVVAVIVLAYVNKI